MLEILVAGWFLSGIFGIWGAFSLAETKTIEPVDVLLTIGGPAALLAFFILALDATRWKSKPSKEEYTNESE